MVVSSTGKKVLIFFSSNNNKNNNTFLCTSPPLVPVDSHSLATATLVVYFYYFSTYTLHTTNFITRRENMKMAKDEKRVNNVGCSNIVSNDMCCQQCGVIIFL